MTTVDGLININTASAQTLAAVPFFPLTIVSLNGTTVTSSSAVLNNRAVAQAIVTYRNTYGPFKTLFDLNRVTIPAGAIQPASLAVTSFNNLYGNPATTDYGLVAGGSVAASPERAAPMASPTTSRPVSRRSPVSAIS